MDDWRRWEECPLPGELDVARKALWLLACWLLTNLGQLHGTHSPRRAEQKR